ncbi:MAG: tyrosine--tRNA ligase [Patescibacteria group bacterium]|mgnify:CR=1 FL=1
MTASTRENKITELLDRGVERVYPTRDFLKNLLTGAKKLTVYLGIDPSGPALHLGHAIPLMKLHQLQELGHKVILLIGDFTAVSGDPDKTEVRTRLTRERILANCRSYRKQAGKLLKFTGPNAAEYRFNSTWLSKLTFADVIDLASKSTVQRMLERDLFERRMKSGKPLYQHEFLYPLMQGYDGVAMNVDGEVGGNDQTFNMLTGRDLMKQYKNREKFVLTMKLLEDPTGKKMGKTEGNMVTLTDSPKEMFGKIMSWTDGMIAPGFELLTDLPITEIKEREKMMKEGSLNPRDAKAELARRVVAVFHTEQKARHAEAEFVKQFTKKEVPSDIPTISARSTTLPDLLVKSRLVSSKSEAQRLMEQGAVKVNGEKVSDWKRLYTFSSGDVVQVGKRKFVKIV